MQFFESVWEGIKATSLIEWLAVVTGIIYVVLASKRMISCWFFAFVSSSLFVYLCFISQLYIESILQVFYVAMAILGWFSWKKSNVDEVDIQVKSVNYHLLNILFSGIVAFLLGYIFDIYTSQANPYIDAITTCYSLLATYMVTKKILENWIYWIVIDIVSIYLYSQRGYNLTAVQYALFTLLALYGFWIWKKTYKKQFLSVRN